MPGRLYDRAIWKRLRARFLAANPLCEDCRLRGRTVVAVHADHRVSIKDAPERALDPTNLAAKCHSCHSAKTTQVDGGFGRTPGQRRIKGCTVDGMPLDPGHFWNAARER